MTDEEWVRTLYGCLLNREPRQNEVMHWVGQLEGGLGPREFLLRILSSKEYLIKNRVKSAYPPGHYYSPIVDPEVAVKYASWDKGVSPDQLKGLRYPVESMSGFWSEHADLIASTPFTTDKTDAARYYSATARPARDPTFGRWYAGRSHLPDR